MPQLLCCVLAAAVLAAVAAAADDTDKSAFTLFNPTPSEHLRELSVDGPTKTASPYTVDAGHFQLEMNLVSYTYDRSPSRGPRRRLDEWSIAPMNLKVGLLNQLDAQLLLETYDAETPVARGEALRNRSRPVRRAVVHDDALPARLALPRDAAEAAVQRRLRLVGGQQDR